ncbi:MAG TPA: hypothetical protein PKJ77_07885 [Thermodesulfobacteriota bacterium]|nr:hypothetical protein [Thermodesulfobacteriota bacterium]HOC39181.1 hypothetical protein [Thermodesulfobacteriota bacterium]
MTPDGRARVVIEEEVRFQIDCSRFPVKREIGRRTVDFDYYL